MPEHTTFTFAVKDKTIPSKYVTFTLSAIVVFGFRLLSYIANVRAFRRLCNSCDTAENLTGGSRQ